MHHLAYHDWSKNDVSLKLARYVYDLNTFYFYWKLSVSLKGQREAHLKQTIKKCKEFIKILILI